MPDPWMAPNTDGGGGERPGGWLGGSFTHTRLPSAPELIFVGAPFAWHGPRLAELRSLFDAGLAAGR